MIERIVKLAVSFVKVAVARDIGNCSSAGSRDNSCTPIFIAAAIVANIWHSLRRGQTSPAKNVRSPLRTEFAHAGMSQPAHAFRQAYSANCAHPFATSRCSILPWSSSVDYLLSCCRRNSLREASYYHAEKL